jgi:hypothetical protein
MNRAIPRWVSARLKLEIFTVRRGFKALSVLPNDSEGRSCGGFFSSEGLCWLESISFISVARPRIGPMSSVIRSFDLRVRYIEYTFWYLRSALSTGEMRFRDGRELLICRKSFMISD